MLAIVASSSIIFIIARMAGINYHGMILVWLQVWIFVLLLLHIITLCLPDLTTSQSLHFKPQRWFSVFRIDGRLGLGWFGSCSKREDTSEDLGG